MVLPPMYDCKEFKSMSLYHIMAFKGKNLYETEKEALCIS